MNESRTLQPPAAAEDSRAADAIRPPRATLLLVDDQPARLMTYEAILGGMDVQCVRASSGAEALERLLKQEFAVILLDVEMPGMDGFEVARLVREHPRMERTPIIFVTGVHVSELDRLKGYGLGAIDYISVPVVPEILRSKVAMLVELHLRRRELQAVNRELHEARARLESERTREVQERKNIEQALRDSNHRKDEFLAMLAHELRNPVAPISNAAEVLSRMLQRDGSAAALVAMIQRQCSHLGRLLDDLLDVARITQGRIPLRCEHVAVAGIVDMAVESVQNSARQKGQQLTVMSDGMSHHVNADKIRLEQCVMNLLSNAVKYTPNGGRIQVRYYADADQTVIEVSDSGIGIDAELLPHVFDLFAQGKRSLDREQGGLGIGLAICKQLVEMHGGRIECRSAGAGHGSTFTICLPLAARVQASQSSAPRAGEAGQRVLIVDDNGDAADSLAMFLQLEGHETRTVYSAAGALEQATLFEPHTVLLDIGLPGMDGYEVARRLRTLPGAKRLIALTGYGQDQDRQRSATAGFDAHLVKPVDLDKLKELLVSRQPL